MVTAAAGRQVMLHFHAACVQKQVGYVSKDARNQPNQSQCPQLHFVTVYAERTLRVPRVLS
jgi:hypothetical protein